MALLWPIIRPFLGYIVGVIALLGAVSGFYWKARHDGVVAERVKVEREKQDAIKKGNEARDHVRTLCGINPATMCPADWFRD